MILTLFLRELAPADRTDHCRSGLLQPATSIETSYIADYFGHLFPRRSLALYPWMSHNTISIEASLGLYDEQAADQVLR